nr:sigma factor [Corynebacterium lipophiloflavum]
MTEAPLHVTRDVADEMLTRCAAGDRAAFAELYDLYSARVYGIALRVVRDPALADDVAHDAWLSVWDRAASFDPARGSAAGWVMSVAHRRAVDTVRRIEAARARASRRPTHPGAIAPQRRGHRRVERGPTHRARLHGGHLGASERGAVTGVLRGFYPG